MRRAIEQPAFTRWLCLILCLLAFGSSTWTAALQAQGESASQETLAPVADIPDAGADLSQAPDADRQDEAERKRQKAIVGMLVLALVCFVFLLFILVVILWARRIRNLTHKPLPEQHPGDPLWYLRSRSRTQATDDHDE